MSQNIIAIGDIHGCFKTLQKLINKVNPSKTQSIVFLGDYIDRGPRVKQTIDFLIDLKEQDFQVTFLMGNHESMLLNAYSNPANELIWRYNGANKTLQSFGISKISQLSDRYLHFFQSLEMYKSIDNYLFVHAGFRNDNKLPLEDPQMNLWSRNEKYTASFFINKKIIHGHTPITISELNKCIDNLHNVLNIDTGCVYNLHDDFGFLTAIELPGLKVLHEVNCD